MLMYFGCVHEGHFFLSFFFSDGQSNVEVELLTKNYVEKGSSVTLYCRHNFALESIYKVNNRISLLVCCLMIPFMSANFVC